LGLKVIHSKVPSSDVLNNTMCMVRYWIIFYPQQWVQYKEIMQFRSFQYNVFENAGLSFNKFEYNLKDGMVRTLLNFLVLKLIKVRFFLRGKFLVLIRPLPSCNTNLVTIWSKMWNQLSFISLISDSDNLVHCFCSRNLRCCYLFLS